MSVQIPPTTTEHFLLGFESLPSPPILSGGVKRQWLILAEHIAENGMGVRPTIQLRDGFEPREVFTFLGALITTSRRKSDLVTLSAWLCALFQYFKIENGPLAKA